MTDLIRADLLLAESGRVSSRTAAQQLIAAGRVFHIEAGKRTAISKPSQKLLSDALLEIEPAEGDSYVSRGGLKLAGALVHTGLKVDGAHALDVGISTGGFTDCLLQAGASRVVGIDVGHGQLHPTLSENRRVFLLEGINARSLDAATVLSLNGYALFDLAVADVSFISLTLVLPAVAPLIKAGGHLLCLVKPQFEVGRDGVGRGGIVRDISLYQSVRERLESCCHTLGLEILDWFDSPIEGGDGNHEFFLHARRPQTDE
jgi:23S rRNA (cytidine1920-2'-O)/16S rRNA (cytidine1409-2'-O)-methyltransferase